MNLKQLTSQLRREAKANPQKTAVLAALALVAAYFWAPLIGNLMPQENQSGDEQFASAEGSSVPATAASSAGTSPTPVPQATATTPWQQIVRWIENDPRMRPDHDISNHDIAKLRDPFVTPQSMIAVVKTKPEIEPETVQERVTPESLKMVLSSTILGGHRPTAVIDGRSYARGDWVPAPRNHSRRMPTDSHQNREPGKTASARIRFRLVKIMSREVILDREGEIFSLKLPNAQIADTDYIGIASGRERPDHQAVSGRAFREP